MDTNKLRARLKLKAFASEKKLLTSHAQAAKFYKKLNLAPGKIRQHAAKLLTSGALASSLLLSAPPITLPVAIGLESKSLSPHTQQTVDVNTPLSARLKAILPEKVEPISNQQEQEITKAVKDILGIDAVAKLEGNHLNQTYGYMGAEQHLPRYPGDTAEAHGQYISSGITPGLGGWGYVQDSTIEKYYIAVQTLYLPDWKTNTRYLSRWYKFRKCLAINPNNGKAIVVAVADAGPSWWTGKHFGGSPEVMAYLGHNVGMQKGPSIIFFVDDPNNLIPLGPIEYNKAYDKYLL